MLPVSDRALRAVGLSALREWMLACAAGAGVSFDAFVAVCLGAGAGAGAAAEDIGAVLNAARGEADATVVPRDAPEVGATSSITAV